MTPPAAPCHTARCTRPGTRTGYCSRCTAQFLREVAQARHRARGRVVARKDNDMQEVDVGAITDTRRAWHLEHPSCVQRGLQHHLVRASDEYGGGVVRARYTPTYIGAAVPEGYEVAACSRCWRWRFVVVRVEHERAAVAA